MRKLIPLVALGWFGFAGAHAAISVGPAGSGIISFGTLPPASEWSTRSLAGTELTFTGTAALDAAVQTNSIITITNTLLDGLGATPPGQNTLASWSGGGTTALWTRPAANSATLLLATVQNDTGVDQDVAKISYTLAQSAATPGEQVVAHQVYYSFTGTPGTWVKIPALSGSGPGARTALFLLNGVWANGAPLYILWVDDNTTGGVDRGYSIDDVSFTGRPPPTLEAIPNQIAEVLQPVFLRAFGSNTVPGGRIAYSLDPGAPATAQIHATNGYFIWSPARADATTTNPITIRATDVDAPASSAAEAFTVVVRDYVELTLQSVVMEGGQRTNVLLELVATAALTNLQVTLLLPADRLTAPAVDNLVPSVATMSLDDSQPGRLALAFAALPGQFLAETQALARLHFTAVPDLSSAFVPLQMDQVTVARALPGLAPSLLLNHGRAVVMNREPLLEVLSTNGPRSLVLYGRPGTNYTVETAPGVLGPWQPWQSVALATLFTTLDASEGTGSPVILYRAREGTDALPELRQNSPGSTEKAVKAKKVKKAKKKAPASRLKKPAILPP